MVLLDAARNELGDNLGQFAPTELDVVVDTSDKVAVYKRNHEAGTVVEDLGVLVETHGQKPATY